MKDSVSTDSFGSVNIVISSLGRRSADTVTRDKATCGPITLMKNNTTFVGIIHSISALPHACGNKVRR